MSIALPTNRDENWRYVNLRPLTKANADDANPQPGWLEPSLPPALDGYQRWFFSDGHCTGPDPSADARVRLLDARVAGESFAALLDADLATAGVDFALARVNAARGDEVMQIELPDDSPPLNIDLVFHTIAPAANGTSYPRVQLIAGRNTSLRVVERHLSASGDSDAVVNAAFDVALRPGATVDHVRVQNCADKSAIFDTLVAHVGDRARYRLHTVTLGGATSRSTLFIKLAGRDARCELSAASIANGIQTHDMFAEIEHLAAGTVTRELFRGIASERGKLAFNGKMIVRETAHDADSDQSLKSLLTGSGAEAAARPQLEIYTDRVRAKHGATIGKLDEQMMFYLLSRGIERVDAQALLQWAFVEDAISRIEPPALRREIETLVSGRLHAVSALTGLLGERT
jgi:Fe-S cluster assembly protein SufD